MRKQHKHKCRDLGATELMRSRSGPPSSAEQETWYVSNWLYFYRNKRQQGAAKFMGDLDDLKEHQRQQRQGASDPAAALQGASAGDGGEPSYERASTGMKLSDNDMQAARTLVAALDAMVGQSTGPRKRKGKGVSQPPVDSAEVQQMAAEIGRRRHHAELAAMMCIHFSNAPQLAFNICSSQEDQPEPSATGRALHKLLLAEQKRLVDESCLLFGHGSDSRGKLPKGTLEEALQ